MATEWLSGLELEAAQRVYGSLAIVLAESIEAAPPYARSALSRSLVEVIGRLEEGENDRRREAE